jgi:cytochrome c-type biogenesis protein CcmE
MLRKNKLFKQRLFIIIITLFSAFIGLFIILYIFNENIVLYKTPSALLNNNKYDNNNLNYIRLGGIVKNGSVKYKGEYVMFTIYDNDAEIKTIYKGVIPSLFKEGQNVIVYGKLSDNNMFDAKELLAKHDENYRP